jgi:hypothetical protein
MEETYFVRLDVYVHYATFDATGQNCDFAARGPRLALFA